MYLVHKRLTYKNFDKQYFIFKNSTIWKFGFNSFFFFTTKKLFFIREDKDAFYITKNVYELSSY